MPEALARELAPARGGIPVPLVLGTAGQPYGGEVREEQNEEMRGTLAVGGAATIVGLRRAWRLVGFSVDPGTVAGAGLVARLRIKTRGVNALTSASFPIAAGFGPVAFTGLEIGARCEVVLVNGTAGAITGIRAAIWGMNEE